MGSASDSESESELKGEDSWRSATSDFCVETGVSMNGRFEAKE